MSFKQFLENNEGYHTEENSVVNPSTFSTINSQLELELNDLISSPEVGIQKIRRVLGAFQINVPAFYDLDPEGNEIVFDLNEQYHLYIIYAQREDNITYDFYAELTDNEGLEEILSDEDDEEEIE
jgi:hypothetical protein